MFKKVLIANRGEIAVRIIRACKEMGISTVAIYSDTDRDAMHVHMADQAICIGGALSRDSYLNINAIITVAHRLEVDAIHPGYGYLSENVEFARKCKEYFIKFIGPSAEVIEKMGDKDVARKTMKEIGVPVVPGTDVLPNKLEAIKQAKKIGFPLLIKAKSGGGGKGIRLVERLQDFEHAYEQAEQEALKSFGDGGCYIEKFLSPVKHIEMQVLADEFDNIVVLGERECSVQRRNQKMIEETPSLAVSKVLRPHMIKATRNVVKTVGYTNAGTIEYLLDSQGHFYFMEMNTRLQVEHPVTEMTTGIDIVKWQIRIAMGLPLTFVQADVRSKGASIECRINAENPKLGFRPSAGTITSINYPAGPWVRFDTSIYYGYTVPPYYDSMIGKLIVWANTREEAINRLKVALCELGIEGIDTNVDMQLQILNHIKFKNGDYYTNFIANEFDL
ncbi:MAG: acetyl-CoA carboxylase biotin carboxylase subunit [Firmicutes bacterium]|nr:acetyl-CoA carboxylase biotin carboxylase subunit [Bacillota bacterium]MCL1953241.1 acetyl-CoA carboxylase biotin carboxylase subunit [Bacillota bacterium]